ncbi:RNA polymerase sigma factor [Chitinophaga deserti]|uniref:RNA polymerase sigma factor n=1 Tax=Chitinophaga deserti TaxID=2164099 RepID=UPI000D6C7E47|nr:sigma-70 family RNA polymerase sigma factor [Chitinophaga deserti]
MGFPITEQSDQVLLEACRNGNSRAFDVLFDRYSGKLYHYGLKYIEDEHQAEEAMLDVMLWLWQKCGQLPADVQLASYLFRAMKNAVVRIVTRQRRQTVPLALLGDSEPAGAFNADSRIRQRQLETAYLNELAQLSGQRQTAFRLSRQDELTHLEIARKMNLSPFTVKNHIKASLSHFRDQLKDYADISTVIVICILNA